MNKLYTYTHRTLLGPLEHSRKYFKELANAKQAVVDTAAKYAADVAAYLEIDPASVVCMSAWTTDRKMHHEIRILRNYGERGAIEELYKRRVYFIDEYKFED